MIPQNISRNHILKALSEIDAIGTPKPRISTVYDLWYRGKSYSPKYVVSVANKFANNTELSPSVFNGGTETNTFLASRGFEIVIRTKTSQTGGPKKCGVHSSQIHHNSHCAKCKDIVIQSLKRLYGEVISSYKGGVPAKLTAYEKSPRYPQLVKIYQRLQHFRGHQTFVKQDYLAPCDLYVPNPGFVLELDETQHFTKARQLALTSYPPDLPLGFSKDRWEYLCERISAKDNDPVYRDEQRAWYDTLRDFLPTTKGLLPTVRVYMGETEWCAMDPDAAAEHLSTEFNLPKPNGTTRSDVTIATVILEANDSFTNESRMNLIYEVLQRCQETGIIPDVILFPAGLLRTKDHPHNHYGTVEAKVSNMLNDLGIHSVVCIGIDSYDGRHQIAVAVSPFGIEASARKFHPAPGEASFLSTANNYLADDDKYSRIFTVKGARYYLAVCYDCYGIHQRKLLNPAVDAVLDLAHGFWPKGEGNSGDVYFAKLGFAWASKQWLVPVFASAAFFKRPIPPKWPTGIMWNQGDLHPRSWKYHYNAMSKHVEFHVTSKPESVILRCFDL